MLQYVVNCGGVNIIFDTMLLTTRSLILYNRLKLLACKIGLALLLGLALLMDDF